MLILTGNVDSFNNIEIFNEEVKSLANLVTTVMKCENVDIVVDVKKFNGFQKLLTGTTWCVQSMNNVKNFVLKKYVNNQGYVNSEEMNASKILEPVQSKLSDDCLDMCLSVYLFSLTP